MEYCTIYFKLFIGAQFLLANGNTKKFTQIPMDKIKSHPTFFLFHSDILHNIIYFTNVVMALMTKSKRVVLEIKVQKLSLGWNLFKR